MSRTPRRELPRPLRLAVLGTAAVLVAYFAFQSLTRPTDLPDSEDGTASAGVSGPRVQRGDNPLGSGEKIPVEAATLLIRRCLCPQLPPGGPLSSTYVEAAWTDSSGQLLLEYENGIRLYYRPDARTEQAFLADWEQAILDGWPGTIVPLRQTQAVTTERDDEGSAPHSAVIVWLEGPYHLAMHGDGGQSLSELMQLAEGLWT
jgi:hypothetical protein